VHAMIESIIVFAHGFPVEQEFKALALLVGIVVFLVLGTIILTEKNKKWKYGPIIVVFVAIFLYSAVMFLYAVVMFHFDKNNVPF
jgi:hypothetical protein